MVRGKAASTWALLALAPALMGVSGCSPARDLGHRLNEAETRELRLVVTGGSLPASASDAWFLEKFGADTMQWIRFDTSLEDAKRLAARLIPDGLSPEKVPDIRYPGDKLSWWIKETPKGAIGGINHRPGGPSTNMILLAHGNKARVWIFMYR